MAKKEDHASSEALNVLSESRAEWSIGDARTHFSELIRDALEAPQVVRDKKSNADDRAVAVVSLEFLKELLKASAGKIQQQRVEEDERERTFRDMLNMLRADTLEAARLDGITNPASDDFLLPRQPARPLPTFGDDDD